MKLTIDQQIEKDFTTAEDEFSESWLMSTAEIYQNDRLIYCVDIDGQVLYNQYEDYIRDHLQQIKHIHITTLSRLESIHETEKTLQEYLIRFIPAIASIADGMYGEVSPEMWGKFSTGIEGLKWIVDSFEFMLYLQSVDLIKKNELSTYCAELDRIITELDANLSGDDIVGVGDLLQYELIPHLQKYQLGTEH